MPYLEDFCEISGNSVWRKIVKFDNFQIRDPTLLSGVLCLFIALLIPFGYSSLGQLRLKYLKKSLHWHRAAQMATMSAYLIWANWLWQVVHYRGRSSMSYLPPLST